jgi:hypothetical protein
MYASSLKIRVPCPGAAGELLAVPSTLASQYEMINEERVSFDSRARSGKINIEWIK